MPEYDDSFATCALTYASFRVLSPDVTSDEITARLGIIPSETHALGDPVASDGRGSRRDHGWFLGSRGHVDSLDARRHLDWLLDQLEPARDGLTWLREQGALTDILCFWASAHGHGGPVLGPRQMGALARLELECSWDVYFWNDLGEE